jgi:hypothetical protein
MWSSPAHAAHGRVVGVNGRCGALRRMACSWPGCSWLGGYGALRRVGVDVVGVAFPFKGWNGSMH